MLQSILVKALNSAIGWFYLLVGPLIHIFLITQRKEIYAAVDDQAIAAYQFLWNKFVLPNLIVYVILLTLFEIGVGALILSKNPLRPAYGHLAGLIFNLLLLPFGFSWGIPNLLLAACHGWLYLRIEHRIHGNWSFMPFTLMERRR